MKMTLRQRSFRTLLDRRGLLLAPDPHEEKYRLMLDAGPLLVDRHPTKIREAVEIAKAVFGEGNDEHAEIIGLYALREEIERPTDEPREIVWVPYTADGPGLNPEKWVRLDAWLDDQFLFEDAIQLRYERDVV